MLMEHPRRKTREVRVGNIGIGGEVRRRKFRRRMTLNERAAGLSRIHRSVARALA